METTWPLTTQEPPITLRLCAGQQSEHQMYGGQTSTWNRREGQGHCLDPIRGVIVMTVVRWMGQTDTVETSLAHCSRPHCNYNAISIATPLVANWKSRCFRPQEGEACLDIWNRLHVKINSTLLVKTISFIHLTQPCVPTYNCFSLNIAVYIDWNICEIWIFFILTHFLDWTHLSYFMAPSQ